jgi:hypothetical protein
LRLPTFDAARGEIHSLRCKTFVMEKTADPPL